MEKVWIDKCRYDNAEKLYQELLCKVTKSTNCSQLASEIAKAREHIQSSLEKIDDIPYEACSNVAILGRIAELEAENKEIRSLVTNFTQLYNDILKRILLIENNNASNNKENNVSNIDVKDSGKLCISKH